MSGVPTRITEARFFKDLNQATAVSNISNAVTAGVAVPKGFRHELAHVLVVKNATCTLKLWGLANTQTDGGKWFQFDKVSLAENDNECVPIRGIAAFQRVQASVNAIGASGAINVCWGFSE
jgi:hypothetical protein